MKFFENFDKVYCINLDRRHDRFSKFRDCVQKYDLGDFKRVSAVDGATLNAKDYASPLKNGELGLLLTNEKLISNAIQMNYSSILILEDDCTFTEEILKYTKLLEFLPEDWDMYYMGGNHNTHMGLSLPPFVNEKIIKIYNTCSTHFVSIRNIVYKDILSLIKTYRYPLDVAYTELQKSKNVYCYYPGMAKQIADYSDIQNTSTDYDWLIK